MKKKIIDFIYRLIAFLLLITFLPLLLIILAFDMLILNNEGNFLDDFLNKWKRPK